jgi:hypothetical protein
LDIVVQILVVAIVAWLSVAVVAGGDVEARHPAPIGVGVPPREPRGQIFPSLRSMLNRRPFPPMPRWRGEQKGW